MKRHPLEKSLWYDTAAPAPETHPLDGDQQADVVVIGGGYTGLSTALHLAQRGVEVTVIEAEQAGYGGSGRNASHCSPTFLHHTPAEVEELLGPTFGPRMVRLQVNAAQLVFGLIERYDIDCEAAQNGLITAAHTPSALPLIEDKCAQYTALGKDCRILSKDETAELTGSDKYHGAWLHPEAGHLNPLGYARGLARAALKEGAKIYTATPVTALKPAGTKWRAERATGSVTAEKVVVATNAYSGDLWPKLDEQFFRLVAFNVASEPLTENVRRTVLPENNNVIDTRHDTHFYKLDKDGRIVTGSVVNWQRGREAQRSWPVLARRINYLFPQIGDLAWSHLWHGYIAMAPQMMPKLYSPAPGVTAAFGFSGRGVPTGTAVGTVLADWASGTPEGELAMPFFERERILTRRVLSFAVPNVLGPLYRWQDRRGMRRDGLEPPAL